MRPVACAYGLRNSKLIFRRLFFGPAYWRVFYFRPMTFDSTFEVGSGPVPPLGGGKPGTRGLVFGWNRLEPTGTGQGTAFTFLGTATGTAFLCKTDGNRLYWSGHFLLSF